eukprot:sb/3473598/
MWVLLWCSLNYIGDYPHEGVNSGNHRTVSSHLGLSILPNKEEYNEWRTSYPDKTSREPRQKGEENHPHDTPLQGDKHRFNPLTPGLSRCRVVPILLGLCLDHLILRVSRCRSSASTPGCPPDIPDLPQRHPNCDNPDNNLQDGSRSVVL